jgi:hypothetical protein
MLFDSFYLTPMQMTRPYEETRSALIGFMWLYRIERGQPVYVALTELALSPDVPDWVYEFALSIVFSIKMEEDFILNGTGEDECLETMDGTVTALMPATTHSE